MRSGTSLIAAVGTFIAIALSACSGSDDDVDETAATASPTAPAGAPVAAQNLAFEDAQASGRAAGWYGGGEGYALTSTTDRPGEGRRSGRIAGQPANADAFGTYTQCLPPATLRGKRITYRGMLRTGAITGSDAGASLWLRVDGPGDEPVFFDNMSHRKVLGNAGWKTYEIKVPMPIPDDAMQMCFGVLLIGAGVVDADALALELT